MMSNWISVSRKRVDDVVEILMPESDAKELLSTMRFILGDAQLTRGSTTERFMRMLGERLEPEE